MCFSKQVCAYVISIALMGTSITFSTGEPLNITPQLPKQTNKMQSAAPDKDTQIVAAYFDCIHAQARKIDDGKSDASTIATALKGSCRTQFNRLAADTCLPLKEHYYACRAGYESTDLQNIIAIVLEERAAKRTRAKAR
jgi:hypothetical protein